MKFVRTRGFAKQTMLCAKYDYKMDIAVKQEEAFEDGQQQKAIEDAVTTEAIKTSKIYVFFT